VRYLSFLSDLAAIRNFLMKQYEVGTTDSEFAIGSFLLSVSGFMPTGETSSLRYGSRTNESKVL
jgi:hypothetical protein